jgi:hypothetical protein
MKQPPPFQHAPLKFTAKKCAAKKFLRRTTWLARGGGNLIEGVRAASNLTARH